MITLAADAVSLKECCCKKGEHGREHHDPSHHNRDHEASHHEQGQDLSDSGMAHHAEQGHHSGHNQMTQEPSEVPCDDSDPAVEDGCCALTVEAFTEKAHVRVQIKNKSLVGLVASAVRQATVTETIPIQTKAPPGESPPDPSTLSRQILFATFLL